MKKYIDIRIALAGVFALLMALPFASCDTTEAEGAPVIFDVRTTDPALKDSTFVKAFPGQVLLIEGANLASTRKIYINDQDVYFNPNYVLPSSIILTIPAELEIFALNPELPKEIRIENPAGVATYAFHVLAPAPIVARLQIDSYPAAVGDSMTVVGENFYEIVDIVFEGENGTEAEVTSFTVNDDVTQIAFNMPAGAESTGNFVVYTEAGSASVPYALELPPPSISSISSDMPVRGAGFFITGTYFIDVQKVNINGEIDIPAEDLKVSAFSDTIYLKLPSLPTKSGVITITAGGGNSNSDKVFYPVNNVVLNWDDRGAFNYGAESQLVEEIVGISENRPYTTSGKAMSITMESASNAWWFGVIANVAPFTNAIPDNTPTSDLVLRFECFVTYPLQTITWGVKYAGTEIPYIPISRTSGETELGHWMTCEISLSDFAPDATTYGDVKVKDTNLDVYSKNDGQSVTWAYEVFWDNFRIVPKTY